MSDEHFFRDADEREQRLITGQERKCRSFIFLLLLFSGAFVLGLISFFIQIRIGTVLAVFMIAAGCVLIPVTVVSIRITKRQLGKVEQGDYRVQDVIITEVHNEIHGLRSNQYVTFTSGTGENYIMNTNTTGDAALVQGAKGLLVILNDEQNILLTCKYRFFG